MNDYKIITLKDIVDFVKEREDIFPKGLDTPIVSGDFECNYTHGRHFITSMMKDEVLKENSVCLEYEMHENLYT